MTAIVNKIKAIIAQGENSAVEFKASGVHADSIAREMVAFANSQGGVIPLLKKFTVSCLLTLVSTAITLLVDRVYASCCTGIGSRL